MSSAVCDTLASVRAFGPIAWGQIPDFGLYMDQVVTFVSRAYAPLYGEDAHSLISPSMINNYVKARLIPRPTGKKYGREQVALLLMIVPLKQTSSIEDIRRMLTPPPGERVEALYATFSARFCRVVRSLCGDGEPLPAPATALEHAIMACAHAACCAAMLKNEAAVQ